MKSNLSVIAGMIALSALKSRSGSGNITSIESLDQLEAVVRSGDGSSVRRIDITFLSPESFEDYEEAQGRFQNKKRKLEQLLESGAGMFPNVECFRIRVDCKANELPNSGRSNSGRSYYSAYDYSEINIPSELDLGNLIEVDIYDILVSHFGFLMNSPKVKKVVLGYCGPITDWKPFLNMKNLESLYLDFVGVPDNRIPRELIANKNLKKLFVYNMTWDEEIYLPSNLLSRTFDDFFFASDDRFNPVFDDIDHKDMQEVIKKRYMGQMHEYQSEILEQSKLSLSPYLSPALRRF